MTDHRRPTLDLSADIDPIVERLARTHAQFAGRNPDQLDTNPGPGRDRRGWPWWRYFVAAAQRDLDDLAAADFAVDPPPIGSPNGWPIPIRDVAAREVAATRLALTMTTVEMPVDGPAWRQMLANARYILDIFDCAGVTVRPPIGMAERTPGADPLADKRQTWPAPSPPPPLSPKRRLIGCYYLPPDPPEDATTSMPAPWLLVCQRRDEARLAYGVQTIADASLNWQAAAPNDLMDAVIGRLWNANDGIGCWQQHLYTFPASSIIKAFAEMPSREQINDALAAGGEPK